MISLATYQRFFSWMVVLFSFFVGIFILFYIVGRYWECNCHKGIVYYFYNPCVIWISRYRLFFLYGVVHTLCTFHKTGFPHYQIASFEEIYLVLPTLPLKFDENLSCRSKIGLKNRKVLPGQVPGFRACIILNKMFFEQAIAGHAQQLVPSLILLFDGLKRAYAAR